jgi:ABC-type antimicrobial peptide transport system permease subunit
MCMTGAHGRARNPSTTDDVRTLAVSDLLVATDSPATLERVRTTLSTYAGMINRDETPMTFGEIANVRAELYLQVQRMISIIAGITMLIAGCSLAVAVTGSLVERKRPFTLMRVAGVGTPALYRAVLLETVLPLVAATGVAAGVGLALAYPIARVLAPDRHALVLPQPSYLAIVGAALVLAIAVIASCLPLLGRITHTDNARFE